MLLAVGKAASPSPAGRFTGLGFRGVRRTRGSSGPSRPAPRALRWEPSAAGPWEALQSTVNSQGSCFPVLVSLTFMLEQWAKPTLFPLRNEDPGIPWRGEFLSAFLLLLLFLNQIQTVPSVPCFRFLTLATTELRLFGQLVPSPGVPLLLL